MVARGSLFPPTPTTYAKASAVKRLRRTSVVKFLPDFVSLIGINSIIKIMFASLHNFGFHLISCLQKFRVFVVKRWRFIMKIAVSATGGSMSAQVSGQFGRCAYFLIVDSETMKFEPISNPAQGMMGGAGPEAARVISSKGAEVVLTGGVGPNAKSALDAAGIKIVTGYSGGMTVKEAVEKYLNEKQENPKQ
jgi:predicted Fe-Mo cluster-binding NifX family protein